MYSKFKLSIIGRINVLKTLTLPKLVYLFTLSLIPPNFILDVIEKGSWQNIFEIYLGITKKMALELDQQSLSEMTKKCVNQF